MSAVVVRRPGRKRNPWAVVVTQTEPQRLCSGCRAKVWTSEHRGDRCPSCSAPLGPGRDVRRQRWHGFGTQKEARDARSRLDTAVQDQAYVAPSRVTLAAFLEEWRPATKATRRATTEAAYETNIRVHVLPALGATLLRDLRPERLNRFYADLADKGLAPKTVANIARILHRALSDAVRWHRLARNPATDADPPKANATKAPEMRTWSTAELASFLRHVEAHRLYAGFALAGATGMRRGELLGLRWQDLDLRDATVTIVQSVVLVGGEPRFSDPKTQAGGRTISLHPATVGLLRAHKAAQAEQKLALGSGYADHGLVFSNIDGRPMRPDVFSQAFDRAVKAWGGPAIRFHDLRHSHVRHLIEAGVHVQRIRDRVGHSSAAFTLDRYGRFMKGQDSEAAKAVGDAIFGGRL